MSLLTYAYKGRDGAGKLVKGRLEAPSEGAVVARLRTMGLSPVEISESAGGTGLQTELNLGFLEKRVGLKDLSVMSRQLATMVASGLSILRALTILAGQTENPKLARALTAIRAQVEAGSALSDAFARQGTMFPPIMIHLIRAGEAGGFLDQSLESIAKMFESDVKLRQTIKSALTYPVVVLAMAIAAVIAMLIFIVPIFKNMFADLGGELPLPTLVLVALSENMIWAGPLVLVAVIAGVWWWNRNKYVDAVRARVDPLKLRLPVFGMLFKKIAIARFARNFSTLTRSGVPILQALAVVADTSGNWVVEQAIRKVQDSVRSGRSIAAPLAEEPVFPPMVVQMISVGEDAGSLELMLGKIADFYDEEVQSTTEQLTALIEPLMIGVIGIIIGGMITALYMPMFTIFQYVS